MLNQHYRRLMLTEKVKQIPLKSIFVTKYLDGRKLQEKGTYPRMKLCGLQVTQFLGGEWNEIKGVALQPIWESLACGKNYKLNSHLDDSLSIP